MYEEFFEIPGFNNRYHINKNGDLKMNYAKQEKFVGKLMTDHILRTGYRAFNLICIDGKRRTFKAHRLVAVTFIPNPQNKPCINHINSDRLDNRVENLEWCTYKENTIHTIKMGRANKPKGESHPHSKLTNNQVLDIFKDTGKHYEIAEKYKVHPRLITFIKNGVIWSHVTGKKYKRKRLTESQVLEIKKQIHKGVKPRHISKKLGVPVSKVQDIKTGGKWKHVVYP